MTFSLTPILSYFVLENASDKTIFPCFKSLLSVGHIRHHKSQITECHCGEAGKQQIDRSLVQVSYGDLPLPSNIKMKRSGDYLLQFSWDKKSKRGNNYDQAMLLVYDCNTGHWNMQLPWQFRSSGGDELKLVPVKKQNYHVYIGFLTHDRSRQLNNVYLGKVST